MALLGVQLIVTLLTVSIMQKVCQRYSFGRWILCKTGLVYYLHPSDEELRTLAGIGPAKEKGKNRKNKSENEDKTFMVPRNLEIQLETSKIFPIDVVQLKFYSEFQWVMDYAVFTLAVYLITEVYYWLMPKADTEVNLSMLWCALLISFTLKSLCSITGLYFRSPEAAAERSLVLVGGSSCFVLALALLLVNESNLELGLNAAYSAFNNSATVFLESSSLSSEGPASKLILKLCVALWCGISGALFIFPGLRVSRMHWDALKYCGERPLRKALLYLNFVSPFLISLLWIKPLVRDYFTSRVFTGMDKPLLTDPQFDSLRLWLCVSLALLRLVTLPWCLQSYLNLAQNKLETLKREAGRISNIELQRTIARIFYYLCVVGLQYIAPVILCVTFTLMYKTLGQLSWLGTHSTEIGAGTDKASVVLPAEDVTFSLAKQQWTVALSTFRQIFSSEVFRGLFGFCTWWTNFLCFLTMGLGVMYQTYFNEA
nr:EOG090X04CK [Eulimnadia texana]